MRTSLRPFVRILIKYDILHIKFKKFNWCFICKITQIDEKEAEVGQFFKLSFGINLVRGVSQIPDLQLDVLVVGHSLDFRAHVALGHVVVAVLAPVAAVAEVAQLFPVKIICNIVSLLTMDKVQLTTLMISVHRIIPGYLEKLIQKMLNYKFLKLFHNFQILQT